MSVASTSPTVCRTGSQLRSVIDDHDGDSDGRVLAAPQAVQHLGWAGRWKLAESIDDGLVVREGGSQFDLTVDDWDDATPVNPDVPTLEEAWRRVREFYDDDDERRNQLVETFEAAAEAEYLSHAGVSSELVVAWGIARSGGTREDVRLLSEEIGVDPDTADELVGGLIQEELASVGDAAELHVVDGVGAWGNAVLWLEDTMRR